MSNNTTALLTYPSDLNADMALGEVLAESGFFADAKGAAQAVAKILAGRELGLGPLASMSSIYIVKGKPTFSATLLATLVRRSGTYDYRVERLDNEVCLLQFLKGGQPVPGAGKGLSSFTMKDAQTADLVKGDNWKHYPRNMLFARALSNGVRWYCPEVMAGGAVYTHEELQDAPEDALDVLPVVKEVPASLVEAVTVEPAPPPLPSPKPALPRTGLELEERLLAMQTKLMEQGLCKSGDLVRHVVSCGEEVGYPSLLAGWPLEGMKRAATFANSFKVQCLRRLLEDTRQARGLAWSDVTGMLGVKGGTRIEDLEREQLEEAIAKMRSQEVEA